MAEMATLANITNPARIISVPRLRSPRFAMAYMPPRVSAMPASINIDKIVPAMKQAIGGRVDCGNIADQPL